MTSPPVATACINVLLQITYRRIPGMAAKELLLSSPSHTYSKIKRPLFLAQSGFYLPQNCTVLNGICCIFCTCSLFSYPLFHLSWAFLILSSSTACCITIGAQPKKHETQRQFITFSRLHCVAIYMPQKNNTWKKWLLLQMQTQPEFYTFLLQLSTQPQDKEKINTDCTHTIH